MLRRLTLATAAAVAFATGAFSQNNSAPDEAAPAAGAPKPAAPKDAATEKAVPKSAAAKPILTRDLESNVRARLVAARFSETRGRYLIAKFETLEKAPATRVVSFPAHSFTVHEQTLRGAIMGCVDMTGDSTPVDGWYAAQALAVFSLPWEDAPREPGRYSQLDRCFLISLKLKKNQE